MCAFPMSRLTVRDGTQVAYERQGSGSTVVLVHGGFLDHRAWGGLQAILVAAGHTVVAPDRRGHGFSDPYGPRPEVADDAGDLAEIVAAVAEPGTTVRVIAHSSGGHSALAAAALTELNRRPRSLRTAATQGRSTHRPGDLDSAEERARGRRSQTTGRARLRGGRRQGRGATAACPFAAAVLGRPIWPTTAGECALDPGRAGSELSTRRQRRQLAADPRPHLVLDRPEQPALQPQTLRPSCRSEPIGPGDRTS